MVVINVTHPERVHSSTLYQPALAGALYLHYSSGNIFPGHDVEYLQHPGVHIKLQSPQPHEFLSHKSLLSGHMLHHKHCAPDAI